MKLSWGPREPPLTAEAVVAVGARVDALILALRARPDDALALLSGVAGGGVAVVIGERLPWFEGAVYLGRDPRAPALLLPTLLAPSVPPEWLESAVLARVGGAAAVLPDRFIDLGAARPVERARLVDWR